MKAFIFDSALLCEACGEAKRQALTLAGQAPADVEEQWTYDSGDFPKGPYSEGGGEADTPQHCDACGMFLQNPLTSHGLAYVRQKMEDVADAVRMAAHLGRAPPPARPIVAEWADFYADVLEGVA